MMLGKSKKAKKAKPPLWQVPDIAPIVQAPTESAVPWGFIVASAAVVGAGFFLYIVAGRK